jgi:NitT/TauT family transport system permease protein
MSNDEGQAPSTFNIRRSDFDIRHSSFTHMIRKPIGRPWKIGLGIASFVVLAGIYTALSQWQYSKNPSQTIMPGWRQLGAGVARVLKADEIDYDGRSWLWVDSKASFTRLLYGLALGCLLGVVIGVAMGCYEPIEAFFLPPLSFLAKIPPTAYVAVFYTVTAMLKDYFSGPNLELLFFVGMITLGILPGLAQAAHGAAKKDVPDELIDKAFTLGASQAELIWNVVYKQILPRLLEAVRLSVGPAMVYLLAAEWNNTDIGFGFRLRVYGRLLQMNVVYVYLIYLGLVGLAIDFALTWLRRKLCPWFGE